MFCYRWIAGHQDAAGEEGPHIRIGNGHGGHRQADQARLRPAPHLQLPRARRTSHPSAGLSSSWILYRL